MMEQLEEENLSEKPWYLQGEVASAQRPQNSALEEHLEYDIAVRQSKSPYVNWTCISVCHSVSLSCHLFVIFFNFALLVYSHSSLNNVLS